MAVIDNDKLLSLIKSWDNYGWGKQKIIEDIMVNIVPDEYFVNKVLEHNPRLIECLSENCLTEELLIKYANYISEHTYCGLSDNLKTKAVLGALVKLDYYFIKYVERPDLTDDITYYAFSNNIRINEIRNLTNQSLEDFINIVREYKKLEIFE
jgi:hypothetical protein